MQGKTKKIRQIKMRRRERKFIPFEKSQLKRDYEKMIRRLNPQELEQLNQELERDINRKYDDEW